MIPNKFTRWGLIIASCATLALPSCKDNDDAYDRPTISVSQVTKDSEGKTIIGKDESTATLHISSNRAWTATTALDWLSIQPESGQAGEHDVTIRVLKNTSRQARQGQFAFRAGGQTIFYTITQAGDGSAVITPGKDPNQPQAPVEVDGTDLANFIKKYDTGQSVTVDEEVTFKAVLLSDIPANNMVSLKNIIVQAGDQGITLRLASNASKDWKPGMVFTIKTKGTKVGRYQEGSLQIDYTGVADAGSMVTPTGEVSEIKPKTVSFADVYAGKYDNVLVAVEGAQFEEPGKALNPNKPAAGKTSAPTYFNSITDCVTSSPEGVSSLSVAISFYSTFKSENASDKNGKIVGIIQRSTTTDKTTQAKTIHYNLWPRTLEDLKGLTAERCSKAQQPAQKELLFTVYIEGAAGNEKYLQIYNPSDVEVDLSQYSIQIKAYGKNNTAVNPPNDKVLIPLSGKLAPKASIVCRHTKAELYTASGLTGELIYNGNDPIALIKGEAVIDFLGNDPAKAWLTADGKAAGEDVFLHRKVTVDAPSRTFVLDQWDATALTKDKQKETLTALITEHFGKR